MVKDNGDPLSLPLAALDIAVFTKEHGGKVKYFSILAIDELIYSPP